MLDTHNTFDYKRVLSPASVSDNTAQVGQIIDTQGYDSAEFIIATGSIADADATFTTLLEESDDSGMSGAAGVDDANLIGTESAASPIFSSDDSIFTLGYRGGKRYLRLTITPAANASAAVLSAVVALRKKKVGTL